MAIKYWTLLKYYKGRYEKGSMFSLLGYYYLKPLNALKLFSLKQLCLNTSNINITINILQGENKKKIT